MDYLNVELDAVHDFAFLVAPDLQATIVLEDHEMVAEWIERPNADREAMIEAQDWVKVRAGLVSAI